MAVVRNLPSVPSSNRHQRSRPNFSAILPLSRKTLVIDWAADRLMLGDGDVAGMRQTHHPDLQLRTRRAGAPTDKLGR